MAKLKAGILKDLKPDTLAGAIDGEFVELWNAENDIKLPDNPKAIIDRRLMFVAIARGILCYLQDHQDDIMTTTDRATGAGSEHNHQLEFEWE